MAKFPQAVCKTLCPQTFSMWSYTDTCTTQNRMPINAKGT